jgi:pimeloyl-ACP methyl ester carboxylesterase
MKPVLAVILGIVFMSTVSPAVSAPVETFVEVQGPSGVLKGTMLAPADAKGAPAVVIIPGSGPTDRDGNSPMGLKAAPYRLLAEALAGLGVASVRIDKRGMYASAAAAPDANKVTMADYAADAHAWAAMMRARTDAPCVWLLGHSEGSLVALVASKDTTDLCGLVLVSGAGRPLGQILREQLKSNPANAPLLAQALPAIDKLEAGQHVDVTGMDPRLMPLFYPDVQGFLIDQMSYDPAKLAAAYNGLELVVQGTTDLQVTMVDAERLAGGRSGVTLVKLEGVNHVLKSAPQDRAANAATYADPSLPLAPGVAEAIAAFVKEHGGRK